MKERTNLAKKKEDIKNIVVNGCPLGDDFINSICPVRNARKLTPKNLSNYVDSLSEKQIDGFFIYHEDCSRFFSC